MVQKPLIGIDDLQNLPEYEVEIYRYWEENGFFKPNAQAKNGTFSIDIPPPNVTGFLHMGHGFQNSLIDAICRYQRMLDKRVLWQVGTDHAGISTQMVVERQLEAKGLSRHDLGREQFVEKVLEWKQESGSTITHQLRRLGCSADWTRERFTMDTDYQRAVSQAFIKMHELGLIYRANKLTNWDPQLQTAVSDIEIIPTETKGQIWYIEYPLIEPTGTTQSVVIATTRPETLLGDVAVAVHPDDARYQELVGKSIKLPICNRAIPIVAHSAVKADFGSGCVKITPAHDFTDYQIGQDCELPTYSILDAQAQTIAGDLAQQLGIPQSLQGIDRFEARKIVLELLQQQNALVKTEDHQSMLPLGDRSGVVIEPMLSEQWYVDVKKMAAMAIDDVKSEQVVFQPANWSNTFFAWMENIHDWCISRQLWWGHRIPVWYDQLGNSYVAASEQEALAQAQQQHPTTAIQLRQDESVLDTWFSSGLWSFVTKGWDGSKASSETEDMHLYHPASLLVTGHDIIFFWVARMMMMTRTLIGQKPFDKVLLHGLVRDRNGQKMSKSKGNVLDPLDLLDGIELDQLVEKRTHGMMIPRLKQKITDETHKEFPKGIDAYGADALRMTFYSLASPSRDINFDMGRIAGYKSFTTKLVNATKLLSLQFANLAESATDLTQTNVWQQHTEVAEDTSFLSEWMRYSALKLQQQLVKNFDDNRLDLACNTYYEHAWHVYCDWICELLKVELARDDTDLDAKLALYKSAVQHFAVLLQLGHPLLPFTTEALWGIVRTWLPESEKDATHDTIMLCQWPAVNFNEADDSSPIEAEAEWLIQTVSELRKLRNAFNVPAATKVTVHIQNSTDLGKKRLNEHKRALTRLARIGTWDDSSSTNQGLALYTDSEIQLGIVLTNVIDLAAELKRINTQKSKVEKNIAQFRQRLGSKNFTDKAPADVVAIQTERLEALVIELQTLEEQQKILQSA